MGCTAMLAGLGRYIYIYFYVVCLGHCRSSLICIVVLVVPADCDPPSHLGGDDTFSCD